MTATILLLILLNTIFFLILKQLNKMGTKQTEVAADLVAIKGTLAKVAGEILGKLATF
jgi:hypothetical protein